MSSERSGTRATLPMERRALEERLERARNELAETAGTLDPHELRRRLRDLHTLQSALAAAHDARRLRWRPIERARNLVEDWFNLLAGPLLLLLAAGFLVGMLVPACSTGVMLDLRVSGVDVAFERPAQGNATMPLEIDWPAESLTFRGIDAIEAGALSENALLGVNARFSNPPRGRDDPELVIQRVLLPPAARVTLRSGGGSQLVMAFSPAPGTTKAGVAPSDERVVIEFSAPRGAFVQMESQRGAGEFHDYEGALETHGAVASGRATARLRDGRPVELAVTLPRDGTAAALPLELQGRDVASLGLLRRTGDDPVARSTILRGTVRYAATEMAVEELGYHEPLLFSRATGQIVRLLWRVRPAEGEHEWIGPHLDLLWEGRVEGLTAGRSERTRSLMPRQLLEIFGSRTQLYLFGVTSYALILGLALLKRSPPGPVDVLKPDAFL